MTAALISGLNFAVNGGSAGDVARSQLQIGQWYLRLCGRQGDDRVIQSRFQFNGTTAEALPLAERAKASIPFTPPVVETNPTYKGQGNLVGQRVWLWIDADHWVPHFATAAISGASATVVATPYQVVWDLGDGSAPLTCTTPGVPFDTTQAETFQDKSCTHLYQYDSAEQPGEAYAASATISWHIAWDSTLGDEGVLSDVVKTTDFAIPVHSYQAVITG